MVTYLMSRFYANSGGLLNYMTSLKRHIMNTNSSVRTGKEEVRRKLMAIYKEEKKISERELLRISALTGISYSIVVEIMKECKFN